jgi:hypothetical protein
MPSTDRVSHTVRIVQGLMLVAACAAALFNGSASSPFHDSVAYILYLAARGYPLVTAARLVYVTPVAIAILTLLLAGIPAAIYERIRGLHASTPVSLGLWLLFTLLLTVPTILRAIGDE